MTTLIGNENTRVIHFGKRNRVAVTFKRYDGVWHAHPSLLPRPHRNIRVARQMVAQRLASGAIGETAAPGEYVYEFITRDNEGTLHLYEQACYRSDDGEVVGSPHLYRRDIFSQESLRSMASKWGLRRRHGDPADTTVDEGHKLIAHKLTKARGAST